MADDEGPQGPDWLLRGAFGSLQQAAAQSLGTAGVWDALRRTVGQWSYQTQGIGSQPSDTELLDAGRKILSAQGVGIQQVNQYRGLAGEWRGAHETLLNLDPDEQIRGSSIFQPPWAITAADGVDNRYQFRVKWQITPVEGDPFVKWSTYEVDNPLTTVADLLDQAGTKAAGDRYLYLLSGGSAPEATDYELEQL